MVKQKTLSRVTLGFSIEVKKMGQDYEVKLPSFIRTEDGDVVLQNDSFVINGQDDYDPKDHNLIRDTREFLRNKEKILLSHTQQTKGFVEVKKLFGGEF